MMKCKHDNMGDYFCPDCGETMDDLRVEHLQQQLAAANAKNEQQAQTIEAQAREIEGLKTRIDTLQHGFDLTK